jgi:alpha-tubulin suppressor-like RCC1 family protein
MSLSNRFMLVVCPLLLTLPACSPASDTDNLADLAETTKQVEQGAICTDCEPPPDEEAPPLCRSPKRMCGSVCVSESPDFCGSQCQRCPVPPYPGFATCRSGTCGFDCEPGYTPWGTFCIPALGDDPRVSVDVGISCAVNRNGKIACWGSGVSYLSPDTFTQVSVTDNHSCAVRSGDRAVVCIGGNEFGETNAPTGSFDHVSVGGFHSCGVGLLGTIKCWGSDVLGESTPPPHYFRQVSAGYFHTCGISGGSDVKCWGDNRSGQSTPPAGQFHQVSSGYSHTCGVRADRTVACWGSNGNGESTPPGCHFRQVSAGNSNTCGVLTDGTVRCWGLNSSGQSTPPTGQFRQVAAGSTHSCGVRPDGSLVCWGDNSDGQLSTPTGNFW